MAHFSNSAPCRNVFSISHFTPRYVFRTGNWAERLVMTEKGGWEGRVRLGLLHHSLLMSLGFSSCITSYFGGTPGAGRVDVLWLSLLAVSHSLKAEWHTTITTPWENHTYTHSLRGEPGWLAAWLLDWLRWESMDGEKQKMGAGGRERSTENEQRVTFRPHR